MDNDTICDKTTHSFNSQDGIVEELPVRANHLVERTKSHIPKEVVSVFFDSNYLALEVFENSQLAAPVPYKVFRLINEQSREGAHVKLKTRYGNFLRVNGVLPPWRNFLTHDIHHRSVTEDWIIWDVDVLEIHVGNPPPLFSQLVSIISSLNFIQWVPGGGLLFIGGVNMRGKILIKM